MNNLDIIKRISKKAGSPETEANIFFEILIKKISKVLKDDEKIKVDDIGYFKLNEEDGNKIISFSQSGKFDTENSDLISYLINDYEISSEDPVDSFFSISLEKPEIPVNEQIDDEFFVPPTGYELRSFMDSKADDFLLESKIMKVDEPELEIEETKIEDTSDIEKVNAETEKIEKEDFNIEELSSEKEIENVEEIKDEFKSEPEKVEDKDLNLDNFSSEDELEETLDIKLSDSISRTELNELKDDFYKDDVSSDINIEEYNQTEVENLDDKDDEPIREPDENKFQRVNSLSSKISSDIDDSSFPEIEDSKKEEVKDDLEIEKEEIDEKGFSKVKYKRIKSLEDENKKLNISKRRRKFPVLPILILLLLVGAFFVYRFFINNKSEINPAVKQTTAVLKPSNPDIIQRDYDVPVNYPYEKGTNLLFDGIDPKIYNETSQNQDAKTVDTKPNIPLNTSTNKVNQAPIIQDENDLENAQPIPSDRYQEVKSYIFTDGKIYFVQVSSWKILWRAQKHNSNLKAKGYDSTIEKLISPTGNIYYIVKIGNFSSLKDAENYLAKH